MKRILAAIDFSPASVEVVAAAVALARHSGGAVEVLFVLPYEAPSRSRRRRAPREVDPAVTRDLEGLLAPARAAGIPVRVCLRVGPPAREILEEIRHAGPDVAVLPSRGHGDARGHGLGSVAAQVVREASCPVVTLAQESRKGLGRPQNLRRPVASTRV